MSKAGIAWRIYRHVLRPPRTLADCFRFRNKVGLDVAIETLRETTSNRRRYGITIAQISEMARKCRVGEVMRPYLEAMIS